MNELDQLEQFARIGAHIASLTSPMAQAIPKLRVIGEALSEELEKQFIAAYPGVLEVSEERLKLRLAKHKEMVAERGRKLWEVIHRRALKVTGKESHPVQQPVLEKTFWQQVVADLPCGKCTQFTENYLTVTPPDMSPNYFAWTVEFHNAVNRELGKAQVALTDARQQWQ